MRARLLLLGAALLAFGGSLFAGFHVDDYAIFSLPLLRSLREPHLLTNFTLWLNYRAGGQVPLGYHVVNLLLHLGAVLLAYECLRRLLPAGAAVIAAAVFAVHPLQAEAVNYIAARSVVLAALLCFAALLAWIEARPWLAVAAFAAALLADEHCFALPGAFLLLGRERKLPLACMAALAVAAVARVHLGAYGLALVSLRFLRLLVLPWGFTVDPDVHEPLWLAAAAAVAIAAAAAVWRKRSNPHSEVTWLLAGLVLLIPSLSTNPAADPRMYLPMFAFAAAAGLLLARIRVREVAIGLVIVLAALSAGRTYVWMSDQRLWREAVRRAPRKARPKIELAKTVRAAEALDLLAQARELEPHNPEIPADIGKVLLDEQQYDGALTELSRALSVDPRNALALNNRGVAFAALGQTEAARLDFESALRLDPNLAEARENLNRLAAR